MTTRLARFIVVTLFILVAVAACNSQPPAETKTEAKTEATATTSAAPETKTEATTAPASSSSEPVTVRLAYFPNLTHAPALVGTAKGTFKEALGANVTIDAKTFNAGPALIEALFAGEVDLGYIGPNPAINGYVKSKGEALRIIAGSASAGALFVVRPEANIKTAKDLAGKKLASPQLGNTQDVALRFYLESNGLKTADKGGDVQIIPTQNPDILTLFKAGGIDGAWVPEPWGTRLLQEANGQLFLDERTLWPKGEFVTTNIIASTKFIQEHPDLVKKFLTAHVETVEFIKANPDEAKKIVNSEIERITTKALPTKVLDEAFKNVDVTYDPLPATLFKSANDAFSFGFLGDTKPDLTNIYDLSFLNEILKEKGQPAISADGKTSEVAPAAAPTEAVTATVATTDTAAPGSSSSEAVTVKLAYFPNLTHAPALVGTAKGIFQAALGSNVTIDAKTFNAGPALIEALFAGEVDLGYVGPNPAINGFVKSKGEALRIIAGSASAGALFVVRPEANIKTAKDLAGKKLASPQLGGTQDVALRFYIESNGLQTADKGGDVQIIPTQNPDILTLFKAGNIDGAWVPEPWATRLIQEGKGEVLVDERTLWPQGQFVTTNIIASTQFLKAHPDLVKKFLAAHVETVEFIKANPDEAKKLVNSEIERITTKALPTKVLDEAFKNVDVTYDPLPATLFKSAEDAFSLGFLGETKPDLANIYDLSLLNEVLKEKNLSVITVSP